MNSSNNRIRHDERSCHATQATLTLKTTRSEATAKLTPVRPDKMPIIQRDHLYDSDSQDP
jgi:hypothetical protein